MQGKKAAVKRGRLRNGKYMQGVRSNDLLASVAYTIIKTISESLYYKTAH